MDNSKPDAPVQKTKTILAYEQKRLLQGNAEFLAEIDRAARSKLNVYYKAKRCRASLNTDYMVQDEDGKWTFRPSDAGPEPAEDAPKEEIEQWRWLSSNDLGRTMGVWNNNRVGKWIYLSELDKMLSEDKMERMWMEYDAFMYGGTGDDDEAAEKDEKERAKMARAVILGTRAVKGGYPRNIFPGAGQCISDLFVAGITARSYRTVKTCKRLEEQFLTISSTGMEEYCPLRIHDKVPSVEEVVEPGREAPAGQRR
jgi:hypothetical protein